MIDTNKIIPPPLPQDDFDVVDDDPDDVDADDDDAGLDAFGGAGFDERLSDDSGGRGRGDGDGLSWGTDSLRTRSDGDEW